MTKKVGPEQEAHLAALGVNRNKLQRIRKSEDIVMREVHAQIREGFKMDISGIKLSKQSGLSLPRVYQVRDEEVTSAPAAEDAETEAQPQASSTDA